MKKTWKELFEKMGIDPQIAQNKRAKDMLQLTIVDGVIKERVTDTEYQEYVQQNNRNLPNEELSENQINRILELLNVARVRTPDDIFEKRDERPRGGGIAILEDGSVVTQLYGFGRDYLPDQVTTVIMQKSGENVNISTELHKFGLYGILGREVIRTQKTFDREGNEKGEIGPQVRTDDELSL